MEQVVAVIGAKAARESEFAKLATQYSLQAEALTCGTEEEYKNVAEFGREIKRTLSAVVELFKPMKDSAYQAHKSVCDREKEMLAPLKQAEKTIKGLIAAYTEEVAKRQRQAEEAAHRAATEEAERLLEAAIYAEGQGDAAGADLVLEQAEYAAMFAPVIYGEQAKASGISTAKDYEIVSVNEAVVPILVGGSVIRPVDEKAVLRLIRESKGSALIPGVEYREVQKISIRS